MKRTINPTLATIWTITLGLFLWGVGISVGNYLKSEPERKLIAEGKLPASTRDNLSSNTNIQSLQSEFEKNPSDQVLKLKLANSYYEEGVQIGNAEYLKKAAGLFHEISETDPKSKDSLIGLASLSLHVGASEKASEFYQRYLQIAPDDIAARSNYALSIFRAGDKNKALEELTKVLKDNPNFVIGIVTRGLINKDSGNKEEAKKDFDHALTLEKSPILVERIKAFRSELDENTEQSKDKHGHIDIIREFFTSHPILKDKFVTVREDKKHEVFSVVLKDFPIEQMPEFARNKFEDSLKLLLKKASVTEINLIDSATNKIILNIK